MAPMTFSRIAPAILLAFTLPLAPPAHAQRGQRNSQAPSPAPSQTSTSPQSTPAATPAPSETTAPGAPAPPPGTPKQPEHPQALPNPLPHDKSVAQTVTVNGHTLHYTATVGTIPLEGKDGKPTAEVVYTAYTLDNAHDRPVMFAFNGGPGAASGFLNLGAVGPKRVSFGNQGESPSDPAILTDNPGTWLDFTDLVFIDPVGTGFSRSLVPDDEAKKLFYAPTPDIEYLSLVIYKWLVKNQRMLSKKYVMGESYGGYRGPRITHYLQTQLGVGVNGLFLVSPYLNPDFGDRNLSPIPWMITLPSITAAHLENEHKLTPDAMQSVIAYDEGPYASALISGPENAAQTNDMIAHVTEMTGLDPQFVKYSGGRLSTQAYLREVHREKGEIGSVYDSNVTDPDPFPYSPDQEGSDPILESGMAQITQAMVNFDTVTVGWKVDDRYNLLSYDVGRLWDRQGPDLRRGAVADLREALAADPKLHVVILHGWNDLSCPFMGSILTQNQLPATIAPQLTVHEFPGGHMFYTRPTNSAELHTLGEQTVAAH
ncbi:MAG TPA: peptidase S10 [Acidobacteriaceae bacterium]|nr:peptidase S10 [Acidobacteriaceae bacterium]